ncbi:MAG: SPASM domain-containing protein [Thermodesulfobacteriota bacterium]|nr:SPASM domain-containing protein [Thermodesulfobacteriota bacterium]
MDDTCIYEDVPYIYEIEPTNHCPYKCIMCPRGLGKMTRDRGFMSLDVFARILEMFPDHQKLVRLHHFGEAILHPDIDVMIDMVNQAGRIPVISFNPATLTPALSQRIVDARPGLVCFSFDAFTDQGLEKIRGTRRSYRECLARMDLFIQMSRESGRESGHKMLKVIQTVALDENTLNPEQTKGLDRLKETYAAQDIAFYHAENTGFGDIALAERTKTGAAALLKAGAAACAAPFSEVSILWNGDVVLCCYDYDGFNVIGSIKDNTLHDIWQGRKISQIRGLFSTGKTGSLPLCSRCFMAPHNFTGQGLDDSPCEKAWKEESFLLDLLNQHGCLEEKHDQS